MARLPYRISACPVPGLSVALVLCGVLIGGCGNKGDLYLDDDPNVAGGVGVSDVERLIEGAEQKRRRSGSEASVDEPAASPDQPSASPEDGASTDEPATSPDNESPSAEPATSSEDAASPVESAADPDEEPARP